MIAPNYIFQATPTRIIDGDTVVMRVSPAFKIELVDYKFRLYGIDTYEINSTDPAKRVLAKQAKEFLEANILNRDVLVRSHKNSLGAEKIDSFGRYLVEIFYTDEGLNQVNVNQKLLELGLATVFKG